MVRNITSKIKSCKIEGCNRLGHIQNGEEKYINGYCNTHYIRVLRYGDPFAEKSRRGENRVKNKLLNTYSKMKDRCYNKNNIMYKNYGGRGICVCDRWLGVDGFSNFLKDMGDRPKNKTLNRIDNDKWYCKDNCNWATKHEQASNASYNNEIVGVSFFKKRNIWISYLQVNGISYKRNFKSYNDAVNYRKELELKYLNNG